jgi:hypothetical protein
MAPRWTPTSSLTRSKKNGLRPPKATDGCFFRLVYHEQHAPATEWFGKRGWTAVGTPLADYRREVGRPVPGPDSEAGPMIGRNTLVSAVKAKPSGAARSATAVAFSGLLICWLPTGTLVGFPPTTNRADTCAA